MLPLLAVFYMVGAVWAYTRILLCSGLESQFACEDAISIPLLLWAAMILGVGFVVYDLRALGRESADATRSHVAGGGPMAILANSRVRHGLHVLHPSHRTHVHNSLRALLYAGGAIATYGTFYWRLDNLESGAWLVQIGTIVATEIAIWSLAHSVETRPDSA